MNMQQAVIDFVLHRPRKEEPSLIDEAIEHSLQILPLLIAGEFQAATMQLHTKAAP